MVGIHRLTLQEWLRVGKVRPSQAIPLGRGRTLWRWTSEDVRKLRHYKRSHFGKGRGRKKKAKNK
jgi:predicted site-specific integrase-resolvase